VLSRVPWKLAEFNPYPNTFYKINTEYVTVFSLTFHSFHPIFGAITEIIGLNIYMLAWLPAMSKNSFLWHNILLRKEGKPNVVTYPSYIDDFYALFNLCTLNLGSFRTKLRQPTMWPFRFLYGMLLVYKLKRDMTRRR
jgi:hypothetical protein